MSYGATPNQDEESAPRESESLLDHGRSMQAAVKKLMHSPSELVGQYKPHQRARLLWAGVTALSVLVGLPFLVLKLSLMQSEIRVYLVVISAIFCALAVPISLYSVRRHLLHFWVPPLQIYIVRILWMVPVYSVTTLFSLCFWVAGQESFVYVANAVRQCYEAYTLYNLFSFMIAFLEMEHGVPAGKILARTHKAVSFVTHAPPFSLRMGGRYGFCGFCGEHQDPLDAITQADRENSSGFGSGSGASRKGMGDLMSDDLGSGSGEGEGRFGCFGVARRIDLLQPWRMGDEFVENCRRGVLFYVAVMPPLACLIVVLSLLDLYHEGNFSISSPYAWIEVFYFCTSCWALYCLALFFVVARHDLAPVKPLNKFLLVKGIVFFTWAQSLAISLAFYFVYDYKAKQWRLDNASVLGLGGGSDDDDAAAAQAAAEQELTQERQQVGGAVCDAVMCVEMLFFAVGHAVAFPANQFERVRADSSTVLASSTLPSSTSESASASLTGGSGTSNKAKSSNSSTIGAAGGGGVATPNNNKQWLVEWGTYWARERHSAAGVAYRNSRMFGVADVHADTVSTYKLFGADLARAGATVATAASHAAEDAATRLQKTRNAGSGGGNADAVNAKGAGVAGGGGSATSAASASARSPTPSSSSNSSSSSGKSPGSRYKSPTIASPSALDRATLASAEKGAASRGHSTFARLFAERKAAAATTEGEFDADDGGEFAPAPGSSATGGTEPQEGEFGDENSALLSV